MILDTEQLREYVGQLAMVDGSFDPIHDGHIGYFQAASQFGLPVICNVASDSWTVSKHPVLLSQAQRGVVLDSIRYLSYVHLSTMSTREVLQLLQPKMYIKGNDWIARGGVPADEQQLCDELGIEVKYLETVTNSSSKLLADWTTAPQRDKGTLK
jgi:bifunctional ADP-heptose synthase (sugar kinase/adenylyltransferase)